MGPPTAHGQWQRLFADDNPERLPFGDSTARMLISIAKKDALSNRERVHDLPPSWGTLYELAKLPSEAPTGTSAAADDALALRGPRPLIPDNAINPVNPKTR